MTVSELKHVLAGCSKVIYRDRFTHEIIDYDNLNRRERNRFRNRNVYLIYPKDKAMIVAVF